MSRIIIVLLTLTTVATAHAQFITLGPKVGVNYSKLLIDETFTSEGTDFTYATQDAKVGFLYGAFGRVKIGPVFFQPELVFTQDKTDIAVSSVGFDEVQTLTVNKMDIPLLLGLKLGSAFKVMGGPVKSYVQSTHVRSPTEMWDSYRSNMEDATWGYQVGIGVDIGRFMLEAKYEGGFGPIASEATIGNETYQFDHRQETFQFSLGFMIFK